IGETRLAVLRLDLPHRHHPRRAAKRERSDHETEPAKDHHTTVLGAPARRPRREVGRRLHAPSMRLSRRSGIGSSVQERLRVWPYPSTAAQALPSSTPAATIRAPPSATWTRLTRNGTSMKRLRTSEITLSSQATTTPATTRAVLTLLITNGSE